MLRRIVETKREEVTQLQSRTSINELLHLTEQLSPARGFYDALTNSSRSVSVIAEVKKASPSKGVIRPDFQPVSVAQEYAAARTDAISVLTDQTYFQGNLDYLRQIREAVDLPLLRKDFLIDEIQVVEARAYGADCILLIAAILKASQLYHLAQTADSLGMDVLVEVHDRQELETVLLNNKPKLIGINNRNLHTFQTDLVTTKALTSEIPNGITVVSESGISTQDDIDYVKAAGARAVLVGEYFMRQTNIQDAVIQLVGEKPDVVHRSSR